MDNYALTFYLLALSMSCISEMIYTMKKEQICWASICLLLGCASAPLNAAPQESEEHTNITGKVAEAFIFLS